MRASTLIFSCLILMAGVLLAQDSGDLKGDAARGKQTYSGKGNCETCHRIKGEGSAAGPDLSEIGGRSPEQLMTKLITPDAEINAANRPYKVVLKNGTTVNGRLLNVDTFTVQMMDDHSNLRSFEKSNLRSFDFVKNSPMPSYQGKLSQQEIDDVVAYLETLKPPPGQGRGRGRGGAARAPAPKEEAH